MSTFDLTGISWVRLSFVDVFGTAHSMQIPASRFAEAAERGVPFDGSSLEGRARRDRDRHAPAARPSARLCRTDEGVARAVCVVLARGRLAVAGRSPHRARDGARPDRRPRHRLHGLGRTRVLPARRGRRPDRPGRLLRRVRGPRHGRRASRRREARGLGRRRRLRSTTRPAPASTRSTSRPLPAIELADALVLAKQIDPRDGGGRGPDRDVHGAPALGRAGQRPAPAPAVRATASPTTTASSPRKAARSSPGSSSTPAGCPRSPRRPSTPTSGSTPAPRRRAPPSGRTPTAAR